MEAIMWKKIKELKKNKIRMAAFIALPIVILSWLIFENVPFKYIVAYFPMIIVLLYSIITFSIEDFIFAEVVLSTNITIKKMWLSNIIFILFSGYFYSNILIIITNLCRNNLIGIYNISQFSFNNDYIIKNLGCILLSAGFLSFSTFYISSYSYIRQIISSIGSIINIVLIGAPILFPSCFNILAEYNLLLYSISIILIIFSYLIITYLSNPEELIVNLQNLGKTYESTQTIDE